MDKLILIVVVCVVVGLVYACQPTTFTLDKNEWSCTRSHMGYNFATSMPEMVCDQYTRK
jgi:hypothetical protein